MAPPHRRIRIKGKKPTSPDADPANFVDKVDNKYFPLEPGTTFIYKGKDAEGFERIEVSVTNDTKRVIGVEWVVLRDRVWIDGKLVEDTFDHNLMIKDWNPLEPTAGVAHNYYAPGVGKIEEVYVEGSPERIELIDVRTE